MQTKSQRVAAMTSMRAGHRLSQSVRLIGLVAVAAAASSTTLVGSCFFRPFFRRGFASAQKAAAAKEASVREASQVRENAKAVLRNLLSDEQLVATKMQEREGWLMHGSIDEAIMLLEKVSTQEEFAYSELLDGKWNVMYNGPYSPLSVPSPARGMAMPFHRLLHGGFSLSNAVSTVADGFWGQTLGISVDAKTVEITDGTDVEASADFQLPNGGSQTLRYKAKLMPLSGRRLSEEVSAMQLPQPIGWQVPPNPTILKRGIILTYLDEDMMVVRDESGVPELLERVLQKVPAADDAF